MNYQSGDACEGSATTSKDACIPDKLLGGYASLCPSLRQSVRGLYPADKRANGVFTATIAQLPKTTKTGIRRFHRIGVQNNGTMLYFNTCPFCGEYIGKNP